MDKYADLLAKIDQFVVLATKDYASDFKVFGPYQNGNKTGRKLVIVIDRKGKRRTLSYPRWIMECRMGRPLKKDETVDHKNYDIHDNSDKNLQLLPRSEHSALDTRRVKLIKLKCAECGKDFDRSPRLLRDKTKKGKVSAFCSRQCAGKYARKVQLGQIDKLPVQPYIESEYYRRKNVKAFVDQMLTKYGAPETFIEAQKRLLAGLKGLGWAIEGSTATSPEGAQITIHARLRFPITLYGGRTADYERNLPVEVGDIRETSLEQLVQAINDLLLREDRLRWQTMALDTGTPVSKYANSADKRPLLVGARYGADYDSVLKDLSRFRSDFRHEITRAINNGMILFFPNGKWTAAGNIHGRVDLANTVRLGIDREVG